MTLYADTLSPYFPSLYASLLIMFSVMFLSIACLQIGPRMLTDGLVSNKRAQGKLEASSIQTRYKDTFGKEK